MGKVLVMPDPATREFRGEVRSRGRCADLQELPSLVAGSDLTNFLEFCRRSEPARVKAMLTLMRTEIRLAEARR